MKRTISIPLIRLIPTKSPKVPPVKIKNIVKELLHLKSNKKILCVN
jgi:hypothetical protein